MVIETLRDTLSKVNDWIKFAEAKNAANTAFCSASIFGLTRITLGIESINIFLKCYLVFIIILLAISLSLSLMSFIPSLKIPWLHIGKREKDDNLLYFGHACKYNGSKYLDFLYNNKPHKSDNYEIEISYSNQIVINSKIAYIKYKQFDMAMWFTLTAIISPVGYLIAIYMKNNF